MHLLMYVEADSMEQLVSTCNTISLKAGQSYNFSPPIYDGKKFYTTYYVDLESAELLAKVIRDERSKVTKK